MWPCFGYDTLCLLQNSGAAKVTAWEDSIYDQIRPPRLLPHEWKWSIDKTVFGWHWASGQLPLCSFVTGRLGAVTRLNTGTLIVEFQASRTTRNKSSCFRIYLLSPVLQQQHKGPHSIFAVLKCSVSAKIYFPPLPSAQANNTPLLASALGFGGGRPMVTMWAGQGWAQPEVLILLSSYRMWWFLWIKMWTKWPGPLLHIPMEASGRVSTTAWFVWCNVIC